jgi:hypothetical protein
MPALAQRVVQDLIETGTAEAGMSKPQTVLREWLNMGDETKNVLFRDPYPNTGEAPRVQSLTNFLHADEETRREPEP